MYPSYRIPFGGNIIQDVHWCLRWWRHIIVQFADRYTEILPLILCVYSIGYEIAPGAPDCNLMCVLFSGSAGIEDINQGGRFNIETSYRVTCLTALVTFLQSTSWSVVLCTVVLLSALLMRLYSSHKLGMLVYTACGAALSLWCLNAFNLRYHLLGLTCQPNCDDLIRPSGLRDW